MKYKKILKGLAVVAILAAMVALTIVTMGSGAVVAGVVGAALISAEVAAAALLATATIGVATMIATTAAIGINALVQRRRSTRETNEMQKIKGRVEEIPDGVERIE